MYGASAHTYLHVSVGLFESRLCRESRGPRSLRAFPWRPAHERFGALLARAVDETGSVQPDIARYNTLGYRFGAVVRHPVHRRLTTI